jgi:RNA polymerase sigma-70 factor, ECF subfamily
MGRVGLGDRAAFEELVRRHVRPAVRLAERLLGDDSEAEDVVQESFLAVLEGADRYDASRAFAPWFYRIVANRCSNLRRSRSRQPTDRLSSSVASPLPGPERDTERSLLRDRLAAGLVALPDRQREVLLLYDVDGFTGPEIAALLGVSAATVRWHLHQARAAMRGLLGGDADREDG